MVIKCIFVVNKITKKKTLVIALRINIYSKSTKFEKNKNKFSCYHRINARKFRMKSKSLLTLHYRENN